MKGSMSADLSTGIEHRPWPMPARPWVMRMNWEQLAFLHWRVAPELVERLLPSGLELDTFDGAAWIGVVPFLMTDVGARGLPGFPTTARFLELNVRTYVIRNGKPGVWFFSLDAESWLAVRAARAGFHLPYFDADMDASFAPDVVYRSRRTHANSPSANFRAIYRPVGDVFHSSPGSVEHWLTERYCLYAGDSAGSIRSGEIHHQPWPLQRAEVDVRENSMGDQIGIELRAQPDNVLFARRLPVIAWPLTRT